MARRRSGLGWLLLVLFIAVPLVEIYVIIQVGQAIGPWWTILLLVLDSIFGTWLIRHEGSRAWRALTEALDSGRMPAKELADGALILIGGTLMLAPGFVTDALRHLDDPAGDPAAVPAAADRCGGQPAGRARSPPGRISRMHDAPVLTLTGR